VNNEKNAKVKVLLMCQKEHSDNLRINANQTIRS